MNEHPLLHKRPDMEREGCGLDCSYFVLQHYVVEITQNQGEG
jgi:hypothetical protein